MRAKENMPYSVLLPQVLFSPIPSLSLSWLMSRERERIERMTKRQTGVQVHPLDPVLNRGRKRLEMMAGKPT